MLISWQPVGHLRRVGFRLKVLVDIETLRDHEHQHQAGHAEGLEGEPGRGAERVSHVKIQQAQQAEEGDPGAENWVMQDIMARL